MALLLGIISPLSVLDLNCSLCEKQLNDTITRLLDKCAIK